MEFTKEMRAKAQAARAANRDARIAAAQHYKRDWLDSEHWDRLAKTNGFRLPQWGQAPTPRKLKRWHETLDTENFQAVYGCSPSRLIAINPHTPLRAFVGQMLERLEQAARAIPF